MLTDQELYDDHPEAMDRYGFRVEPAAAFILGKQVARLADDRLLEVIGEALGLESKQRMLDYFLRERSFQDSSLRLDEASRLLEAFEAGWRG